MTDVRSVFWDDHERDLHDPEYLRAFVLERVRSDTVGRIMDKLEEALVLRKLPKTQLARIIGAGDSAVRRLFTRGSAANPTFDTVVKMATTLGYEVVLQPMPAERRAEVEAAMGAATSTVEGSTTGSRRDVGAHARTRQAGPLSRSASTSRR